MGKGDKKSRRGKVAIGSFGKTRPARKAKVAASAPEPVAKPEKKKK